MFNFADNVDTNILPGRSKSRSRSRSKHKHKKHKKRYVWY